MKLFSVIRRMVPRATSVFALATVLAMMPFQYGILFSVQTAHASTAYVVTTLNDHDDGACTTGDCTLREAIVHSSAGDTVTFAPGLNGIMSVSSTLGVMEVSHDLTITGPGQRVVTVNGGQVSRIFSLDAATSLALSGLTLADGEDGGSGIAGAIYSDGALTVSDTSFLSNNANNNGGAIYHEGTSLSLTDDYFAGNFSGGNAGAVYADGTSLSVTSSTFTGNYTDGLDGGALYIADGSSTISNATFSANQSEEYAGAIYVDTSDSVTITGTTFAANTTDYYGGAIYHNAGQLTVTNSTFKDNSTPDDEYAGAIYGAGTGMTITGSTFTGNTAEDGGYGGALYICEDTTINSSNFTGNSATDGEGGALYDGCGNVLNITGSSFTANSAYSGGGAFYLDNSGTFVTSTTFTDNVAKFDDGGAIYHDGGSLTLASSTFTGNIAQDDDDGGAIYGDGSSLVITGSAFSKNSTPYFGEGGAIYTEEDTSIDGSTFMDNASTDEEGGAINSDDGHLTVTDSTLEGNTADEGGAIFADGTDFVLTNSTLFQNVASDDTGAAIYSYASSTLTNDTLADNTGGASVYANNDTVTIGNSILTGGSPDNCDVGSGAIASNGHNIESQDTCGFTGTGDATGTDPLLDPRGTQNHGGGTETIALQTSSTAIDGGDDTLCPSTDQIGNSRPQGAHCDIGAVEGVTASLPTPPTGAEIVTTLNDADDGSCSVGLCTLRDAVLYSAPSDSIGFAPGLTGTITLGLGEIEVTHNLEISGPGQKTIILSGNNSNRIFNVDPGVSFEVNDLTLSNGVDSNEGGAIINQGSYTSNNVTFRGNFSGDEGGAIYDEGTGLTLSDATFSGNYADDQGGAVYEEGTTLADNGSSFLSNFSDDQGGALYLENTTTTLTGTAFTANGTSDQGGAVYADGNAVVLSGASFDANTSRDDEGGAIDQENGTLSVGTTTFTGNNAIDDDGGAIYGDGNALTVTGSSFTGNSSYDSGGALEDEEGASITGSTFVANLGAESGSGGAIAQDDGDLLIGSSTFDSNSTYDDGGGAILLDSSGSSTVSGSTFTANNATDDGGGAIYADAGSAFTVTNSTFQQNSSDDEGGAVYVDISGPADISSSTFTDNSAESDGGAVAGDTTDLTLTDSTFTHNSSRDEVAGAVYFGGTMATIDSSTFMDNASDDAGGAIYLDGTAAISNSTLFQNSAGDGGGGLGANGPATLNNVTFSQNTGAAGNGDSLYIGNGATTIQNTILNGAADNNCGGSGFGSISSNGHNLDTGNTCDLSGTGDVTSTDPLLDPAGPANHGGPTLTLALIPGSPAVDAGSTSTPGSGGDSCEATDQRGVTRPVNGVCDMGAFELNVFSAPTVTSVTPSSLPAGGGTVTVIGTGLRVGTNGVKVGSTFITTSGNSTQVTFTAPAGSGGVALRIYGADGNDTNSAYLNRTLAYASSGGGGGGGGGGGLGSAGSNALPPLQTTFQSYLANLQNIGIPVHALLKLLCGTKAASADPNDVCKAVYYVGADGMRHAFPNSKVFFTWYSDFSGVQLIGPDQLASIPLGKNVTYKPGVKMVKFTTDPKVYAVDKGGILRWVATEGIATSLYGTGWNTLIDDINDAFHGDYTFGADINSTSDFNPATATASVLEPSDSLQQ